MQTRLYIKQNFDCQLELRILLEVYTHSATHISLATIKIAHFHLVCQFQHHWQRICVTFKNPFNLFSFQNCVTHSKDFQETSTISLKWKAPNVSVGDLVFTATVAESYEVFWVNISAVLTAKMPATTDTAIVLPPLQVNNDYTIIFIKIVQ